MSHCNRCGEHRKIEGVNEYFKIDIKDRDNDTIGGWIFSQLEKVPEVGDQVTYDKHMFFSSGCSPAQIDEIPSQANRT
ncbi:transporter associated domain-containing protein [Paenactinomyces guangxiensis]|uniref:Transporter-associated domain-containing protein n=1 Tax=Paenactinomyces guangxiensis TaxID=1490290 RepID=A0A7W1WPZ3_9BACL|nr:hypothetical protein [Paenactinomyces guangxiensis]MBH8591396.1 hypothetical protein [Paenactinomyces guangxiensis]